MNGLSARKRIPQKYVRRILAVRLSGCQAYDRTRHHHFADVYKEADAEMYGLTNPEKIKKFLGIPMETTQAFWRRSLELYLGTEDAGAVDEVENKVKVISMMRMIRHELRRDGLNREDGRKAIETFRAQLAELLPKVDSLTI